MKKLKINSKADITAFITYMTTDLSVSFHPDDSFFNIISIKTGEPTFAQEDAAYYDEVLSECFNWCSANKEDIYEIGLNVISSHLKIYH